MNHQQNLCDVKNVTTLGEIIVKVKPQSKEQKIEYKNNIVTIWVKEPADKDKANKAVIKALTKFFGKSVKIKRGFKSKTKTICF